MPQSINHLAFVPQRLALERLDRAASDLFPQYSRAKLQTWIKSGELTVDGELRRPKDKVFAGEELEIEAWLEPVSFGPEPVHFDVVFEDDEILVVEKPVGLVVHPGAGNMNGTLLNGLLHHCKTLDRVPRAGIVHRLDKDTSGLLVVAKTITSQHSLVQQLQSREVSRIYEAIVYGVVELPGSVDAPLARDPGNRTKMTIREGGKEAITHYRVLEKFPEHCHLELSLETGRTHQIRVHMQSMGHPLIGDPTYGGHFRMPKRKDEKLVQLLRDMGRQALHARRLSLRHPGTDEMMTFSSDLPRDMMELLDELERLG